MLGRRTRQVQLADRHATHTRVDYRLPPSNVEGHVQAKIGLRRSGESETLRVVLRRTDEQGVLLGNNTCELEEAADNSPWHVHQWVQCELQSSASDPHSVRPELLHEGPQSVH